MTAPDALFLDFQAALAGRYALDRELGRGGMGIVYLARDLRLERVVAVKLLPPQRALAGGLRERFLREARTAAKLSHPHIIPIHAVEETGAFVYFVMAFVDGETLSGRVRRDGALRPPEAARVLREVAWALAYAHAQGVVHRDVKPDNILLERGTGRALVLDFGIARLLQAPGVSGEGELTGTPEYMSPEQASGDVVDGRADLYSLGIVGFFALTGRLPFVAPTVPALLVQQVTAPPPRLEAPGAPRALVSAVERCLAKDPAARFQSGEELADALSGVLAGRPELPLPVRLFLSESRNAMRGWVAIGLVGGVLVPTILSAFLNVVFAGNAPGVFRLGVTLVALGFGATALAAPIAFELRRVRRLLGSGYEREDLVRGLAVEAERLREERDFSHATIATRSARSWRAAAYGSLALAAATGAAAWFVPYPAILGVFAVFGLSCASAMVTGVAANAANRRRLGREEERRLRFWDGRVGRWLFRLAGLFGKKRVALPPADRPTEMALGFAALDLFDALPPEMRQALGDVPAVVRGLEDDARRLGRLVENSGPQKSVARQRRGEAMAALENLRLDLLRLTAGVGSLDNLTQDLEAAREVGQEVDRLLNAHRETGPGAGHPTP